MRRAYLALALFIPLLVAFSFGGSGSPFTTGESVSADNMNEIDAALDALEDGKVASIGDCTEASCFDGSGAADGTELYAEGSLSIIMDADSDGSSSVFFQKEANANVVRIEETGDVTIGNSDQDGKIILWNDDAGGDGSDSFISAANHSVIPYQLPAAIGSAGHRLEIATTGTPNTLAWVAADAMTECFTLYGGASDITTADSVDSVWRAPAAVTISEVWCETDTGTVTADLQIDDGTPADVMGTDLVCDTSGETDNTSLTGTMALGDRLDLEITSVASTPVRLTFCANYTYN